MKIKFWGTRGSIPVAEPEMMKYGGNTPCIEIRLHSQDLIIIDAGTGIRRLGINLLKDTQFHKKGNLFISHCHWDHIQGFPFFQPAFLPEYEFSIYGQFKLDGRLEDLIRGQMEHLYFPIKLDQMGATIKFIELIEETVQIGSAKITARHLNHPQGNMGFRIEDTDGIFTYCSDTEHYADKFDTKVLELADGADIFVYDAQFSEEEYEKHMGWGHSTWKAGTRLSQETGVGQLVLFHHDPSHDDQTIDNILSLAREHFPQTIAASRDLQLELNASTSGGATRKINRFSEEEDADYSIERRERQLYVIVPARLEVFNSEKFITEIIAQINSELNEYVFDFQNLQEIDSRSLGTMAQFHEKMKHFGGRFILTNVNDFVKEVLTITRFTQVVEIHD